MWLIKTAAQWNRAQILADSRSAMHLIASRYRHVIVDYVADKSRRSKDHWRTNAARNIDGGVSIIPVRVCRVLPEKFRADRAWRVLIRSAGV